ncbi:MAG: hypothetical protein ACFFB2_07500 [Promethearchaeota archaeon]
MKAQELFQGCICGHRLFRIVRESKDFLSDTNKRTRNNSINKTENINFLSIQELEIGVYDINVDKIFASKSNIKGAPPLVVGNNGVFSIYLKHQKK